MTRARIVFDLDGTLIDSAPDIHQAANRVLVEKGFPGITLAQSRGYVGHGAGIFIERMRQDQGIPDARHEELLAAFLELYESAVHLTLPYAGVEGALTALAGAGHMMGICTNKPIRPTQAVLRHLDLQRHFDVVFGGDSLSVRKPDPAPLLAALDGLGQGAAIFVGDSEVDAETADRAGVPFLLYTEGYRHAPVEALPHTHTFDDFEALPRLVTSMLKEMG